MGNFYLDMLELFLEQYLQDIGILDTVLFQHDGAPPHFAYTVHDYLKRLHRKMDRGSSAVNLLFTGPFDVFAWKYLKSNVYTRNVNGLPGLRNLTTVRSRVRFLTLP